MIDAPRRASMPCRQLRKWASILTGRKSSMLVHVLILGNRLNQMRTDPLVEWGVAGASDGVNVDPQTDRMSEMPIEINRDGSGPR